MTTKFVLHGKGHLVQSDAQKNAYEFKSLSVDSYWWQSKGVYAVFGFVTAIACNVLYQFVKHQRSL